MPPTQKRQRASMDSITLDPVAIKVDGRYVGFVAQVPVAAGDIQFIVLGDLGEILCVGLISPVHTFTWMTTPPNKKEAVEAAIVKALRL
jgi:hypothetical protein